jgi:predicted nucleotidyltransferase
MDFSKLAQENIILKVRTGSHLFGTNTPESDTDYEGVFMPPEETVFGLGSCKEVDLGVKDKDETGRNTKDAIDFKIREYRDFCRLALDNNPNILNILFANEQNIIERNEYGKRLMDNAMLFPHQGGIQKYIAYAKSQLKKMGLKPENYSNLEQAAEYLEKENQDDILAYAVERATANGVKCMVDNGIGKHILIGDISLERALKIRKAVGHIKGRIERASHRVDSWKKYGFDVKFGANLIQILMIGIELEETGKIVFPLAGADFILGIKRGSYSLEFITKHAEDLVEFLKNGHSILPAHPRYEEVNNFVMSEMKHYHGCRDY